MNKAYDVKRLIELCRQEGGPEAEKLAKANYKALTLWLNESAVMSENKIDDVAVPLAITTLNPIVNGVLDQIDGVVA